jgi:predicted ATPase/class 3 adenylate cyclase
MTVPAAALPTGTVTFLFTDIEGSTRLVEEIGAARYGEILESHRRLLRDAVERHGGLEFGSEGDAVFVVFTEPSAAVAAAADGQRALAAATWPHSVEAVRVRMGIHTGEAALAAGTCVGSTVNRAARIAATAHGGQVVLSSVTRSLVDAACPDGTRLRDLGEHRLKDLTEPERIAQLVIAGLDAEFPPLRSLEAIPNNLPAQLTSFVGRERDLVAVAELLRTARLVTLTGPGGTGKTRLALQVAAETADRFADGVWFVPLAPIREPSLVAPTVASAIGLVESPAMSPRDHLVGHLRDKELLLVLDNFEQVIEAAALVADLLRECPRLSALATSQLVLRLTGEHEVALDTLPENEAIRLFEDRARAVRSDFMIGERERPAVSELVRRLDGLPLAIELAAARIRLLEPAAMVSRLDRRFDLLRTDLRDLPERQRTLRGAIDWSHDLLEHDLRRLFARLAVFVGGTTLDDAGAVVGGQAELGVDPLDGLEALVEHSLVRRLERNGTSRFLMLETIREYALERLEEDEAAASIRDRHLARFVALAEEAAPRLTGPDQRTWLDRLEADIDNLRAALTYARAGGDAGSALRLVSALWRFWQIRGHLHEGMATTREVLAMPGATDHPAERVGALDAAGGLAWWLGDYEACVAIYGEALAAKRASGDDRLIAEALYNHAFPMLFSGSLDQGRAEFTEALERYARAGDADGVARAHWGLANVGFATGDIEATRAESAAAIAHFREADLRFDLAWALYTLAQAETRAGLYERAAAPAAEALWLFDAAGDIPGAALVLDALAAIAWFRGDKTRAARLSGVVERLEETSGTGLNPANRQFIGWDPAVIRADAGLSDALESGRRMALPDAIAFAREIGDAAAR